MIAKSWLQTVLHATKITAWNSASRVIGTSCENGRLSRHMTYVWLTPTVVDLLGLVDPLLLVGLADFTANFQSVESSHRVEILLFAGENVILKLNR